MEAGHRSMLDIYDHERIPDDFQLSHFLIRLRRIFFPTVVLALNKSLGSEP